MGLADGTAWEKEHGVEKPLTVRAFYNQIRELQNNGTEQQFLDMVEGKTTARALFLAQEMMSNRAAIMYLVFLAESDKNDYSLLDIAEIIETSLTPEQIRTMTLLLLKEGHTNVFRSLVGL